MPEPSTSGTPPEPPPTSAATVPVFRCLCEVQGRCALHALGLNTEGDE